MVRVAYDGSWFANADETLIWDNPLRLTDVIDGPSQGRMALWPDSTAHTVSAAGSVSLPYRSRAFAYVSVGSWMQDADLLPHTINTAIAPIPLARDTAEADARIVAMTYRFTSRPTPDLWVSAQYRLYDFDNSTPQFPLDQYVSYDSHASTSSTGGSQPFGYTRHFFDVDASYTPWRYAALRAGYGQEKDNRTFRSFETTTDRVVRFSVDSTGISWGSVRVQYDYSKRVGEGLDEQVLDDIGEQTSLRQFDISDRTRNRLSVIAQASPTAMIGLNGSVSIGIDDRPDDQFGMLKGDFHAYTIGLDVTPREGMSGSLTYGFEETTTQQKSRQANPGVQFDDPTRDWWTDMDQDVHTVGLHLDFLANMRTGLSVGYDYVGSRSEYLYTLAPVTTLATPEQLRPVWNIFQIGTFDIRYTLRRQLVLGLGYRYEHYHVEDFAFGAPTLDTPLIPAYLNLMNQWRPYNTHSGYLRLMYSW
jgi:MtrB/PioB family decaheme-associated outer membrane protein